MDKVINFVTACKEWAVRVDENLTDFRIRFQKEVRVLHKRITYKQRVIRFVDILAIEFFKKHEEIFTLIESGEYSKEEYYALKNRIMSIIRTKNRLRKRNILNEIFAKEHLRRKVDSLRYVKRTHDGNVLTHAIYHY